MVLSHIVICKGNSIKEALLYARINQIVHDRGVNSNCKYNSIIKKTRIREIKYSGKYDSSYIIMAFHFGYYYFVDINNCSISSTRYYKFLESLFGVIEVKQFMRIYGEYDSNEVCLGIKTIDNFYKIIY